MNTDSDGEYGLTAARNILEEFYFTGNVRWFHGSFRDFVTKFHYVISVRDFVARFFDMYLSDEFNTRFRCVFLLYDSDTRSSEDSIASD